MSVSEDLLDPAHCVSHALQRTARQVAGHYSEELKACGLSAGQFPILQALNTAAGGAAMTELAQRLGLDRTTLTRNLGPLEREGLVIRRRDPADARRRGVFLTDLGRERLAEGRIAWRRAQARALERIGSDAWRTLEVDLRRLRRALS